MQGDQRQYESMIAISMKAPVLLLSVTLCLLDRLTLVFALEVPLELGMLRLYVLGHGALSPIGLLAASHRTNIIPLNFIGTPSNSLFVLILLLPLLLLEHGDRVRQFFLLLQRGPQLFAQRIILKGQLGDLVGVVLQCLVEVPLEMGDRDHVPFACLGFYRTYGAGLMAGAPHSLHQFKI